MKFIKQLKLLTFQVIVSLIFLNTQISFAQNKINWEGPYVGVGIQSLNGGVNGNYNDTGAIHSRDIDGESMEFHIGYNKDLTQYGVNNYIVGVELSYSDHDFLFNGVKGKRDCPSASWDCKSSINYSWTAKTKLGLKHDNFLPNLFIGYTNNQITIRADRKDNTDVGGTTKTVEGILYGIGADYYLDNNSFIGFSYYETQMNKENFAVDTGNIIDTKLKYNTAKLTYNYRF
jgi:opacity protein-like surface antigen